MRAFGLVLDTLCFCSAFEALEVVTEDSILKNYVIVYNPPFFYIEYSLNAIMVEGCKWF